MTKTNQRLNAREKAAICQSVITLLRHPEESPQCDTGCGACSALAYLRMLVQPTVLPFEPARKANVVPIDRQRPAKLMPITGPLIA